MKIPRPGETPPQPIDRSRFSIRLRGSIPSTKTALNDAVDRVLVVARKCGCVRDNQADLEIALREALANAMIHGNGYQDQKQVFLRCYGAPGAEIVVLVRDEGKGFEPEEVPDPREDGRTHLSHGRGLLLMRELMDYVEYRRSGREVLIYKSCVRRRER